MYLCEISREQQSRLTTALSTCILGLFISNINQATYYHIFRGYVSITSQISEYHLVGLRPLPSTYLLFVTNQSSEHLTLQRGRNRASKKGHEEEVIGMLMPFRSCGTAAWVPFKTMWLIHDVRVRFSIYSGSGFYFIYLCNMFFGKRDLVNW